MAKNAVRVLVTVFAHNEEARIAACLESLPLDDTQVDVAVVVNGSTDRTAEIVDRFACRGVRLVEYQRGGKSRSWNRFVLDEAPKAEKYVFVDGDAELAPGTVAALVHCIDENPQANAVSAPPLNGRNAMKYRRLMAEQAGLFGDCYALAGNFVQRFRDSGIRLPEDLVGDDGLIAALAHTDLGPERDWRRDRVIGCTGVGFYCVPNRFTSQGLRAQTKRMTNYAIRRYQNRIITNIMQREGPHGLPQRLADVYLDWLPKLRPRLNPIWYWFDREALARMRSEAKDRMASA